jgi:hypothetical protein
MVLSAVGTGRRMMVFSGVVSQCEERGAAARGGKLRDRDTLVPAGTLFPPEALVS